MSKIYFAKAKDTQKLYVGAKGHTGFSNIGDLKASITYSHRWFHGRSKDKYDFYYVDTYSMKIEEV